MSRNIPTDSKITSVTAVEAKAEQMVKRLRNRYQTGQEAIKTRLSIEEFAAKEGLSTHMIRKLKRFSIAYSPDDLDELCRLRRPSGLPLHIGHLSYLLIVTNKSERKKLQRRAARQGWSAPRLSAEIPTKYRRSKGAHGRPMKKFKTPADGLRIVVEEADRLTRRIQSVRGILGGAGQKLSEQAATTISAAEALRREIDGLLKELKSL